MLDIRNYPVFRHLRAEPTLHVLKYRGGRLVRSGRGLVFWFSPMVSSIAAVPVDDREQDFLVSGRTRDFQDVAVQGSVAYRIVEPEVVAERIDFGIDARSGRHLRGPLARLAAVVTQMVQQVVNAYLVRENLQTVMREGVDALRERIDATLALAPELEELGISVVATRVTDVRPEPDVEKALQTPARELVQQQADEATFQRRAAAVDKERAIAENELQNRIELAKREAALIQQSGTNERQRADEEAAAVKIATVAAAESTRIRASAEADAVRDIETAKNEAERVRLEAYGELPAEIVFGLAARELATKIETIGHLNVAPESLGPMLQNLVARRTAGGA